MALRSPTASSSLVWCDVMCLVGRRLLFMHNGGIAHFDQIKYSILHSIQHTSASYVRGTGSSCC